MSSFNKVFLMGRLTRDPELRYTPSQVAVTDLGLAINRKFTSQTGERREETLFVDVTVWKKQAETCCQYLKKGSPLFVEGRLTMDTWEGQDGQKKQKIKVVAENFQFIGAPRGAGGDGGEDGGGESGGGAEYGQSFRRGGRPGAASGGGASAATSDGPPAPAEEDVPF